MVKREPFHLALCLLEWRKFAQTKEKALTRINNELISKYEAAIVRCMSTAFLKQLCAIRTILNATIVIAMWRKVCAE